MKDKVECICVNECCGGRGLIDVQKEGICTGDISVYNFVICNLENNEKIAFMKIKKKVSCGTQMPCALGPEPPNFFYLA